MQEASEQQGSPVVSLHNDVFPPTQASTGKRQVASEQLGSCVGS